MASSQKFITFAMGRSGHHAVLNWILGQMPGSATHFNACDRNLDYPRKRLQAHRIKYGSGKPPHNTLHSIENMPIDACGDVLHRFSFDHAIIINRDPYNWLASLMRRYRQRPKKLADWVQTIDVYTAYLQQCLGDIDTLQHPFVDINFNRWFQSPEYRQHLSRRLNIPFSDRRLREVTGRGGGSSFDKRRFNGRADQMAVLDRWKHSRHNPLYWTILTPEVRELSRRYFGETEACP